MHYQVNLRPVSTYSDLRADSISFTIFLLRKPKYNTRAPIIKTTTINMTIPTHSPTERGVWHYYSEAQNVICPKLLQQNSQFDEQGDVPTFAIPCMIWFISIYYHCGK